MIAASPEWAELQGAVEGVYEAFAGYPLRDVIEGGEHCDYRTEDAVLHSKPLRELTCDDLFALHMNAMGAFGNEIDFKHFLPRMLDLVALDPLIGGTFCLDPEAVGLHMARAGFASWPERECEAIAQFSAAWWHARLGTFPRDAHSSETERVLCSIAQYTDDISPYLGTWRSASTLPALGNLVVFVYDNLVLSYSRYLLAQVEDDLQDGWWGTCRKQMRQVMDWARDPATGEHVLRLAVNALEQDPASFRSYFNGEFEFMLNQALDWYTEQSHALATGR